MPHYFFNVREADRVIDDPEGSDLPDAGAARAYAVHAARGLLAAAVREGRLPLDHAIEIADERGHRVDRVTYRESATSASNKRRRASR